MGTPRRHARACPCGSRMRPHASAMNTCMRMHAVVAVSKKIVSMRYACMYRHARVAGIVYNRAHAGRMHECSAAGSSSLGPYARTQWRACVFKLMGCMHAYACFDMRHVRMQVLTPHALGGSVVVTNAVTFFDAPFAAVILQISIPLFMPLKPLFTPPNPPPKLLVLGQGAFAVLWKASGISCWRTASVTVLPLKSCIICWHSCSGVMP